MRLPRTAVLTRGRSQERRGLHATKSEERWRGRGRSEDERRKRRKEQRGKDVLNIMSIDGEVEGLSAELPPFS